MPEEDKQKLRQYQIKLSQSNENFMKKNYLFCMQYKRQIIQN